MEPRIEELLAAIAHRFAYHAPNEQARTYHEKVRAILGTCASALAQLTPQGREQSLMLTHLEEAMFWANAGIARNHDRLPDISPIS